jgi:hypothetical protein
VYSLPPLLAASTIAAGPLLTGWSPSIGQLIVVLVVVASAATALARRHVAVHAANGDRS